MYAHDTPNNQVLVLLDVGGILDLGCLGPAVSHHGEKLFPRYFHGLNLIPELPGAYQRQV